MKSCPAKKGDFLEFFAGDDHLQSALNMQMSQPPSNKCYAEKINSSHSLPKSHARIVAEVNLLCALSTCPGGDLSVSTLVVMILHSGYLKTSLLKPATFNDLLTYFAYV